MWGWSEWRHTCSALGPTGRVMRLDGFTDVDEARAVFEAADPGL